jgi:hypothetical protein
MSADGAEETDMVTAYLAVDDDTEGSKNYKPHELVISDIQANGSSIIWGATTTVAMSLVEKKRSLATLTIFQNKLRRPLPELVLINEDAVCIHVSNGSDCPENGDITIFIALRRGRRKVYCDSSNSVLTSPDSYMRTIGGDTWNLADNYMVCYPFRNETILMETKEKLLDGTLRYSETIKEKYMYSLICTAVPLRSLDPDRREDG